MALLLLLIWLTLMFAGEAESRRAVPPRESRTKPTVPPNVRELAERMPVGIVIYRGSDFVYVNAAFEQLTGFSRDEILARPFWEVVHPEMRDLVRDRGLARQRGEATPPHYEIKLLTKDGQTRWVEYSATVFELLDEPAALGVAVDVTQYRNLRAALAQRQTEISHLGRVGTLGTLAAEIAHELNQPLAAIMNYARGSTLRLQSGSSDGVADALEQIVSEAERATAVVRRVRGFARRSATANETFNLSASVRDALDLLSVERDTSFDLLVDLPETPLPIRGDHLQVTQLVANLVHNAADALRQTTRTPCELRVSARRAADEIELVVADTGPGVDPVHAARLFEPFFTTKLDGLGLGLSISRSIVEAHGGDIRTEPTSPHGLTVVCRFPVASGATGGLR